MSFLIFFIQFYMVDHSFFGSDRFRIFISIGFIGASFLVSMIRAGCVHVEGCCTKWCWLSIQYRLIWILFLPLNVYSWLYPSSTSSLNDFRFCFSVYIIVFDDWDEILVYFSMCHFSLPVHGVCDSTKTHQYMISNILSNWVA